MSESTSDHLSMAWVKAMDAAKESGYQICSPAWCRTFDRVLSDELGKEESK